jgi:hypothetical protein
LASDAGHIVGKSAPIFEFAVALAEETADSSLRGRRGHLRVGIAVLSAKMGSVREFAKNVGNPENYSLGPVDAAVALLPVLLAVSARVDLVAIPVLVLSDCDEASFVRITNPANKKATAYQEESRRSVPIR